MNVNHFYFRVYNSYIDNFISNSYNSNRLNYNFSGGQISRSAFAAYSIP